MVTRKSKYISLLVMVIILLPYRPMLTAKVAPAYVPLYTMLVSTIVLK